MAAGLSNNPDLAGLATPDLWQLLVQNEDRVPRSLIDECARRGDEILDHVERMLQTSYYWTEDVGIGESWLPLHSAMILGLMTSDRAGDLLADLVRHTGFDEINTLEWIEGGWPALFRNKSAAVNPKLRAITEDRSLDANVRAHAADSVLAYHDDKSDGEALADALAWVSRIAFAHDEDPDTRGFLGCTLLDFARPDHRAGLEELTQLKTEPAPWFSMSEVEDAYETGGEPHEWERYSDPWTFYTPEAIAERLLRWAEEETAGLNRYGEEPGETYVREDPKVGRNDPCPCGSGKKYKKCCGGAA